MVNLMRPKIVGKITQETIDLLGLEIKPDTLIYLGESNIQHMKTSHPEDFAKYFNCLEDIIANPDFLAKHPIDKSIQYIKVIDGHVMVGVRISNSGLYYARTIFKMSQEKIERYIKKNALKMV